MSQFLTETEESGIRVLALALPEQLESSWFDDLNKEMLGAIDARPGDRWVLDLSNVDYMGSTLLGLMVNIRQRIKQAGGQLALCCMSERLDAIFRACSLINIFTICKTRQQAIRDLR
jgi:anti-anti-sigma factor